MSFKNFSTRKIKEGNSMQADTVSKISKKIISFFTERVSILGRETGFSQRRSKLTSRAFIETLLVSCLNEDTTYEAQSSILKLKKITITKQGLASRMNDKAVLLLSFLLDEALVEFQSQNTEIFELLKAFIAVKIQDSSGIELPSKLKPFFKGYGGSASSSSLKLQVLYDDMNGSIDKLFVTDGTRNDQGFTYHLDSIQAGALYLQDLGYFCITSFKKIMDGNAYFLSRYLAQTCLYHPDETAIDLLELLRATPGEYYEADILLGRDQRLPVRLIAQRLDENQKEKRLKNIHKSYKKKPSKLVLELAGWSIFVTNIPKEMLAKETIHSVYTLRWQIELFFKLVKYYAKIDEIRGITPYRVLCELYAKLIVIILFLRLASTCRWLNKRELSLPKAYKRFKTSSLLFLQALISPYRLKKFISFLHLQFSYALKDKKTPKKISSYQQIELLAKQPESVS